MFSQVESEKRFKDEVQLGKRTLLAHLHNPVCLLDLHWHTMVGLWEVESRLKPKENGTVREFDPYRGVESSNSQPLEHRFATPSLCKM